MKYLYLISLFCFVAFYTINITPSTYKELNSNRNHDTYKINNNSCVVCKEIVSLIDFEMQKDNATIQDIAKLADELCHDIAPPVIIEECDFYIKNIEEIINWLAAHISIKDICIKFGFCNNFIL